MPSHDVGWSGRPGRSEPQLGVEADAGRGPCPPVGAEAADRIHVRLPDALVRCRHRAAARFQKRMGAKAGSGTRGPVVGPRTHVDATADDAPWDPEAMSPPPRRAPPRTYTMRGRSTRRVRGGTEVPPFRRRIGRPGFGWIAQSCSAHPCSESHEPCETTTSPRARGIKRHTDIPNCTAANPGAPKPPSRDPDTTL